MLQSQHRFHGLTSLNRTYKQGQIVRGPHIALRYSTNPRRKMYRVAVVVSRKVDKSAVVRNRIRRRIYESIRLANMRSDQPVDLIFSVFSNQLAEIPGQKLDRIIDDLLKRSGVSFGRKPRQHAIVDPTQSEST